MVPPYTAVPVFRLGVSIVKSMMYWGSSAGAKHMKDTTTSRVVFLGAGLIGGTGLAADAVARHLSVLAAAGGHHVFQRLPDNGGGLLADDLPHWRGHRVESTLPSSSTPDRRCRARRDSRR